MSESLELVWDRGRASVAATAAMLTDVVFHGIPRHARPFAQAPWAPDDEDVMASPGHLRVLGGDFVCLPFGSAPVPSDAPAAWRHASRAAHVGQRIPQPPHGHPADARWRLRSADDATVDAELTLPTGDVERLRRRVRGVPGRARLEFELEVVSRRDHRTSMGLHPILALPDDGEASIDVAFAWGRVWPGSLHPDARPLPDAMFTALDAVPARGGRADLTRLPPPHPTEEIVQLVGARSPLRIRHDDGTVVVVEWDHVVFPSVLLWLSDRGLAAPPWRGGIAGWVWSPWHPRSISPSPPRWRTTRSPRPARGPGSTCPQGPCSSSVTQWRY